jgi:BirA family transcriptional regulator, biotin operon repressor / biotin---[acetyl-CoA-carboxylase] ligase
MTMTDARAILQALSESERERVDDLEVFAEIGSTNTYLLERPAPRPGHFRVAIAEHQTAGRGRQGKHWISPPSSGLALSVAFTFAGTPASVPSLTLAAGIGIAAALQTIGVRDIGLKWPNDIVARDGKLGGILTELQSRGGKGATVVIGVGLNVELPRTMHIEAPGKWTSRITDLRECVDELPSRLPLTVGMVQCLFGCLDRFEAEGFGTFHAAWETYDWLKGKTVTSAQPAGPVTGLADGIDSDGALRVRTPEGIRRILTGSVTVCNPATACA